MEKPDDITDKQWSECRAAARKYMKPYNHKSRTKCMMMSDAFKAGWIEYFRLAIKSIE